MRSTVMQQSTDNCPFANIDNKNIVRTQDCRKTRQNNCTYGSQLKHTNTKITMNIITQAGNDSRSVDKRQKVIIDFNEDINLWRELKLARSPGRLFHSVITRSEKNFHRDVQLLNCWYFTWLVMAACGRLRFFSSRASNHIASYYAPVLSPAPL